MAREPVSFLLTSDGDMGAGGSDGGVRDPLAEAMVTMEAVRDARKMAVDEERAQSSPESSLVYLLPKQNMPLQQHRDEYGFGYRVRVQ